MARSDLPASRIPDNFQSLLAQVMQRDRHRLQRKIEEILAHPEKTATGAWLESARRSIDTATNRRLSIPPIRIDPDLPVAESATVIGELIQQHQVTVVAGETGSGKSTQLPLIALQAGFGVRGMIGHTQPRRIAARSVAARVAEQLGQPLGESVGYQVRFNDQSGPMTLVKVMTDGILLAETRTDRFLDRYDLLIVDEAHERSLNVDFVLAWLRQLIDRRSDLRVIITSATLDTERFANHFAIRGKPAPVVHVEGRTYPVEQRYQPLGEEATDDSIHQGVVAACDQMLSETGGDLLVFLPTEADIRAIARKLRGASSSRLSRAEVLPLYGRLADNQQAEVFRAHSRPRIVLATNVAESSITVPGIRSVIDVGTARISRYAPRSKVQRLPVEPVSQASANQRAGRCGRVGPGICVRLYSEEDFLGRPPFTTPEIKRTNLAGTLLKLSSLGVHEIDRFPLIDKPGPEAVRDGYRTLFEIGATDDDRRLTPVGRQLARLPVDPRIGRIILAAVENRCLADTLIIAAALETQDVRVRPAEKRGAADEAHAKFQDEAGDYVSILKLWDFIHELKSDLSRSRFQKALEHSFLSPGLVNEWQEVHRQLMAMVEEEGIRAGKRSNNVAAIHRSLLTGFLSGVAMLENKGEYLGGGGLRFRLWPGSSVFGRPPRWIIAGEIVETTRRFGRMIAPIDPAWIESIAEHIVKRTLVDPFWSDRQQTAMAYENVLLFGLPIVTRRRTGLAKIDPETSRDLFISNGLVENRIRDEIGFHIRNRDTLQLVEQMGTRLRDRSVFGNESRLEDFYREHLPAEAVDVRALRELLRNDPALEKKLTVSLADLNVDDSRLEVAAEMPDRVQVGTLQVPVEYRFEPGSEEDGATIRIPLVAVNQIDETQLHWLVPQLVPERVIAVIRSLPKEIRRMLVPAPDVARKVLQAIPHGDPRFSETLAREFSRLAGQPVTPSMFDWDKVDSHLLINLAVVDDQGQVIASARTLTDLYRQIGPQRKEPAEAIVEASSEWHKDGCTDWEWNDLPESVMLPRGSVNVELFPGIVDNGDTVSLRLFDSKVAAGHSTRRGVTRLFALANKKVLRAQMAWLPGFEMIKVRMSRFVGASEFESSVRDLLVRIRMVENLPVLRTREEYGKRQANAVESIGIATQDVANWLPGLVEAAESAVKQMEGTPATFGESVADARSQFQRMLGEGFLRDVPWRWLQQFPRYLRAIAFRMGKLPALAPRVDGDRWRQVARHDSQLATVSSEHAAQGWYDEELVTYRWMIEEFRVSLFAQQLGTSVPVSEKRLEKQFAKVRRF